MDNVKSIEDLFESFVKDSHKPGELTMPLISPWSVKRLADILHVDIIKEPYQVPNIKGFLRTFSLQYRMDTKIAAEEVKACLEVLADERQKSQVDPDMFPQRDLDAIFKLDGDQIYCTECGLVATRYCTSCQDCLCKPCCERLHLRGKRASHVINKILPCFLCATKPSRLQCTFDFNTYCTDCYSRKHAKTLPANLDLRPLRIDYSINNNSCNITSGPCSLKHSLASKISGGRFLGDPVSNEQRTLMNTNTVSRGWHPFLDSSGLVYFYNFQTQESMRRPNSLLQDTEAAAGSNQVEVSVKRIVFTTGPKLIAEYLTKAQTEALANILEG
jgi:hypothetical protein